MGFEPAVAGFWGYGTPVQKDAQRKLSKMPLIYLWFYDMFNIFVIVLHVLIHSWFYNLFSKYSWFYSIFMKQSI